MKTLKNMTGDSLEQMIDYKVVDQNGDSIGTLHSLWSDPTTGAVEFLGVKTGWLFGQNHVVPAGKAELDESAEVVRLPYTEAFIKEAPAIAAEAEISEEQEEEIYQYYGLTNAADDTAAAAPGDNQPGVNYGTIPSNDKLPEAIGGAAVAGASEAGVGGTQFGGPSSTTDDDATLPGASRWRRTSRSAAASAEPTTSTMGSGSIDDAGFTDASARAGTAGLATTAPDSFSTANMFGSTGSYTAPVAADSAGTSGADFVGGASDALAERFGSNVTDPGDPAMGLTGKGQTAATGTNHDPVTGEPGSHPVGTGAGALAGGAAGAAIGGLVGGPVGAPVGAAIGVIAGAVGGGYAGKGIAESINPTAEDAYWQENFHNAPYHEEGYEYADYAPAYRAGYEGYGRYAAAGQDFDAAQSHLENDYNSTRGSSRLTWEKAKAATRDAWDRLKNKTAEATRNT